MIILQGWPQQFCWFLFSSFSAFSTACAEGSLQILKTNKINTTTITTTTTMTIFLNITITLNNMTIAQETRRTLRRWLLQQSKLTETNDLEQFLRFPHKIDKECAFELFFKGTFVTTVSPCPSPSSSLSSLNFREISVNCKIAKTVCLSTKPSTVIHVTFAQHPPMVSTFLPNMVKDWMLSLPLLSTCLIFTNDVTSAFFANQSPFWTPPSNCLHWEVKQIVSFPI